MFWDTSCLLPMILKESRQHRSFSIWDADDDHFAWSWMKVEAEAACVRQRALPAFWKDLNQFSSYIGFTDLSPTETTDLLEFNRVAGLRAADAGHLFSFVKLHRTRSDLELATYDKEMLLAAARMGVPVHPLCLDT